MSEGYTADYITSKAPVDLAREMEDMSNRRIRAERIWRNMEAALRTADEAINPLDRAGISLDKWNERLKAATITIRAALTSENRQ